jgi:large subunit ribosomal protein L1
MNSVDVTGTQAELYELKGALESVVKGARVKFDESVDMDIVLGIDPNKGEQTVRGSALLPHGTGKKVRVIAFARGEHEEAAKAAGADFVGAEDLIAKIEGGWMDFDAAVATPDLMGMVGKVARALGPRGLLPNNRLGTVTFDLASVIKEIKQGRVSFRNDKGGNVHAPC